MYNYAANVRNEIEKLFVQRKFRILMLITAIGPIVAGSLLGSLNGQTGISFMGAGGAAGLPLLMLDFLTVLWLPPILFMAAAEIFAGEKTARTMKNVLTRPITRSAVYASKATAIGVLCLLLLGEVWLMSFLTEMVTGLSSNSAIGAAHSIGIYLAAFIPMMTLALISIFVVQWFSSSTGAFLVMLFVYAFAKALPLVFPDSSTWNVFVQTDWYRYWLSSTLSMEHIFSLFLFVLAHGIISYTAGWYRFEKHMF